MRVGISSTETSAEALLERVLASSEMSGANLSAEVSTSEPYVVPAVGEKRFTVAALDLGIKANTPRMMAERGIEVHVLPATSTLEEVLAVRPDGLFFSNGPGDPATADLTRSSCCAAPLDAGIPFFGICFGNQLFGRALGFGTYKLKYGHRGINQPVHGPHHRQGRGHRAQPRLRRRRPARRAPTETPFGTATVSHVCLNDDVVEGLELHDDDPAAAFSVQYHPEAAAGPHDAAYLFDRFADMMENR